MSEVSGISPQFPGVEEAIEAGSRLTKVVEEIEELGEAILLEHRIMKNGSAIRILAGKAKDLATAKQARGAARELLFRCTSDQFSQSVLDAKAALRNLGLVDENIRLAAVGYVTAIRKSLPDDFETAEITDGLLGLLESVKDFINPAGNASLPSPTVH